MNTMYLYRCCFIHNHSLVSWFWYIVNLCIAVDTPPAPSLLTSKQKQRRMLCGGISIFLKVYHSHPYAGDIISYLTRSSGIISIFCVS
jgi:hypothetical protein